MQTSRRRFLKVIAHVALVPACSAGDGGGGARPDVVGDITAGTAKDLAPGTLRAVSGKPACIGRDADGIYAMTLTCTHRGCDIGASGSVSMSGLHCGCHGSAFDANGNVVDGPATDPLQHFAVSADTAGTLTIHTGSPVDPSTRLKV